MCGKLGFVSAIFSLHSCALKPLAEGCPKMWVNRVSWRDRPQLQAFSLSLSLSLSLSPSFPLHSLRLSTLVGDRSPSETGTKGPRKPTIPATGPMMEIRHLLLLSPTNCRSRRNLRRGSLLGNTLAMHGTGGCKLLSEKSCHVQKEHAFLLSEATANPTRRSDSAVPCWRTLQEELLQSPPCRGRHFLVGINWRGFLGQAAALP